MIRSIDPIAHIDCKWFLLTFKAHSYVITSLIRFLNEFWFVNTNNENVEQLVKNDANITTNVQGLVKKIKQYKKKKISKHN